MSDAAKLLPADPLASVWINYETVKQQQAVKDFYNVRLDIPGTIIFGTLADTLYRSPFVCAALCQDKDGLLLTARLPRGRDGMGAIKAIYLPPDGQPGCRPPLTPKGVLYSESFYMDPAPFWTDRAKLFSDQQDQIDGGRRQELRPVPVRLQLSKLLTEAGPYHRVVVADQPNGRLQNQPKTSHSRPSPWCTEMRDPETFGQIWRRCCGARPVRRRRRSAEAGRGERTRTARSSAIAFPEDRHSRPTSTTFASTSALLYAGRQPVRGLLDDRAVPELIDLLQKEAKAPAAVAATSQHRGSTRRRVGRDPAGVRGQLVTQAILDQAVPPAEAREQVKAFIEFLRPRQGSLEHGRHLHREGIPFRFFRERQG